MSQGKNKTINEPAAEKPKANPCEENLAKEQTERGYYYDDAHGYQKYVPENDGDEAETESGE